MVPEQSGKVMLGNTATVEEEEYNVFQKKPDLIKENQEGAAQISL